MPGDLVSPTRPGFVIANKALRARVAMTKRPGRLWSDAAVAAAAVGFGITIPWSKQVLDESAAPYALVAVRFFLGGAALLPVALRRPTVANEARAVVACAVPLFTGYLLLTVGLERTTSTTAAFLSYLLVIIVPVLSAALYRRVPGRGVAIGIVLSVAGRERLTGGAGEFGAGEVLCLGAALAFAVHVIVLGHFAGSTAIDPVRLSAFQLLLVGAAAAPLAVGLDRITFPPSWWSGAVAIAAVGVAALLLQTVGQRVVGPTRTALILMIDPVVAAAGGYLLGERIGWRGVLGAGLILAGIAIAEVLTPLTAHDPSGESNERYV